MDKFESHLVMYLDRTVKDENPPSLQDVQEALGQGSTSHPKDVALPQSSERRIDRAGRHSCPGHDVQPVRDSIPDGSEDLEGSDPE